MRPARAGGGGRRRRPLHFGGVPMAQGYNLLGIGRGALVMSNIFLSSSFIYLASKDAGCVDENGNVFDEDESCDEKVYGFSPAALISNIAVISRVLPAYIMPLAGAVIDHTPYRKRVGMMASILMILIQLAQAGTVDATWFAMAVLQAITGFFYQVTVMATYAYLPEIARAVQEIKMTKRTYTILLYDDVCCMMYDVY